MAEEKAAIAPAGRAMAWTVTLIAVVMSMYHMYITATGQPEALVFRGTHLVFALVLVFLLMAVVLALRPEGLFPSRA